MRRLLAFFLAISLLFVHVSPVHACDEAQSKNRVEEVLFGDDSSARSADEKTKMLMTALYLCCEQSDKQGQNKIDYLKKQKISKVPSIENINVTNSDLIPCAHIGWDFEYAANKKARESRKKVLINTVNKVFDFGTFNEFFKGDSGKSNSMAALLYYLHILADYLADDPEDTEVNYKGQSIPAYCGQAYIILNGDMPQFTSSQKNNTELCLELKELDTLKRCVGGYAVLEKEFIGPHPNSLPDPVGWNNRTYTGITNTGDVYNRCHIIARRFCGVNNLQNLITGTRYLNETMSEIEEEVATHLGSGIHVAYRVTPIYKGDNLIASGVQIEAYSIEDKGKSVCLNRYCYNVQPGIKINYLSGDNEMADTMYNSDSAIPFAIANPSDTNPDLIFEICKHLKVLFGDKKNNNSSEFTSMMNEIDIIAAEARLIGNVGDKPAQTYAKQKECEYKFFQALKTYVPSLLKNEKFFKAAYK